MIKASNHCTPLIAVRVGQFAGGKARQQAEPIAQRQYTIIYIHTNFTNDHSGSISYRSRVTAPESFIH